MNLSIPFQPILDSWACIISEWNTCWKKDFIDSHRSASIYCRRGALLLTMAVTAVSTPLLALYGVLKYTGKKLLGKTVFLEGGCTHFFAKDIFSKYLKKQKEFLEKKIKENPDILAQKESPAPSQQAFYAWVDLILNPPFDSLKNDSQRREHFLKISSSVRQLSRELKATRPEDAPLRDFLKDFITFRYRSLELIDDIKQKVFELLPSKEVLPTTPASIQAAFDRLNTLPLSNDGMENGPFDAHNFGNIPFALTSLELGGDKPCDLIRMPSVTKDVERNMYGQASRVEIIEEFQLYLEQLKTRNETHLYVNLMNRKHGNESLRTKEIEKLDQEKESHLQVITLDKDSSFYHQNGEFSTCFSADLFKQTFLNELLNPKGRYYFPKKFSHELLREKFTVFMNEIHKDVFQGAETLEKTQRENFIELHYLKILDFFFHELKPSSSNVSCKHCIDRGASQNFSYLYFYKMKRKEPLSKEFDSMMKTLMFGPAIFVSNRPIQQNRLQRSLAILPLIPSMRGS